MEELDADELRLKKEEEFNGRLLMPYNVKVQYHCMLQAMTHAILLTHLHCTHELLVCPLQKYYL